jgi:hypothetical protein
MGGQDDPRGSFSDPDDWFASAGVRPPALPRGRAADTPSEGTVDEPDWLEAETREAGAPPAPPAGQPRNRLALLGLLAFAVIVVIALLGANVFGSAKGSKPPPPTTTAATTEPTTTTPATITAPPSTTVQPLTSGLLKQATSGADVKALQHALATAGHSPGTIDGVFGPNTEQALIAFQQAAGIPDDGVYGPQTKAALEKKLNAG